jgi:hypothetical protein
MPSNWQLVSRKVPPLWHGACIPIKWSCRFDGSAGRSEGRGDAWNQYIVKGAIMSENLKDKIDDAGHKAADATKKAGNAIAEGAEKAADWVKEQAHHAGNKTQEAAQKTGDAVKDAGQKIKDKGGA